ncbi:MFS transporter [Streptomyces sp. NPDC003327]
MRGRALGRDFGRLWAAYGVSGLGTRLAFDAFPLLALTTLHAGAAEVAALAAAGPAAGAVLAVPLGPLVDRHDERRVMIAADLLRCAALLGVPLAYALGLLGLLQLLVVSALVAAADIAFAAAAGACLKKLVPREDLVRATARLESTAWTTTVLGPPLGGALTGLLGPVTTVLADAVSYALSALGLRTVGGTGARRAGVVRHRGQWRGRAGSGKAVPPVRARPERGRVLDGWRDITGHPELRPLFLHTVLVNALVLASAPPLAVLMLGPLGFPPWQYGLAFAVPCLGGLLGSRLAPRLVARFGGRRVMAVSGALRVCWPLGLALVGPGATGLLLVMVLELALITCTGVFNPVFAAHRLERLPADRVARALTAWSVAGKTCVAGVIALWGLLADAVGPRPAIAAAGVLLLGTPLLLLGGGTGAGGGRDQGLRRTEET